jgi:hypothetical protein
MTDHYGRGCIIHVPDAAYLAAKAYCAERGVYLSRWVSSLIIEAVQHYEPARPPCEDPDPGDYDAMIDRYGPCARGWPRIDARSGSYTVA